MGELSSESLVPRDRFNDCDPVLLLHEALGAEGVARMGRGKTKLLQASGRRLRDPGSPGDWRGGGFRWGKEWGVVLGGEA